jgi:hypothetical protein
MSLNIPEHYRRAYSDVWEHTVQQEIQKLGTRVKVDTFTGKEKVYNDIEQLQFTERTGHLTNSTPTEVTGLKRKIVKRDFTCQVIFDRVDNEFLGMLGRPDSEVQDEMKMAWNRLVDEKIAIAASADAYGGVEPYVTPIALPSSQKVAVNYGGSNVGMTPAKIINAVSILEQNDIYPNEEECTLVMSPIAKQNLMAFVEDSPNDIWAGMISDWLNGSNKKLFDLNVVLSNRIEHDSSTDIETAFVYSHRRGIVVCPDKMDVHIDVLPARHHAVQISAYGMYGFTRRYEEAVVTIAVDRTP